MGMNRYRLLLVFIFLCVWAEDVILDSGQPSDQTQIEKSREEKSENNEGKSVEYDEYSYDEQYPYDYYGDEADFTTNTLTTTTMETYLTTGIDGDIEGSASASDRERRRHVRPKRPGKVKPSRPPRPSRPPKSPKPSKEPRPPRPEKIKPSREPRSSKPPRISRTPGNTLRPIRVKTTKPPKSPRTPKPSKAPKPSKEPKPPKPSKEPKKPKPFKITTSRPIRTRPVRTTRIPRIDRINRPPKPSRASKLKFRDENLECKVLPQNCNENKFRFEKCTSDNKFVWKAKDKCRAITTQDERWRWRSIQCKCRRTENGTSCGLETAFAFKTAPIPLNAPVNNRTRSLGHLHGHWESFRKDNGRLNWVRLTIPSCGNIGRAVAQCPALDNMPYYLDRDVNEDIKFGDIARLKCPNRILEVNGTERERVWKVKCGIGEWLFLHNGTSIQDFDASEICPTRWGDWGEWGTCSSSCDGGFVRRERKCHYQGECAITDHDQNLCKPDNQEILSDLAAEMCKGGTDNSISLKPCNEGVKCIRWALWGRWSKPDNKCESRRNRQCQNCLADGSCQPIPKTEQICFGAHNEIQYNTNKPGCKYFLSIEHGSDINIFDIRRGRINYLDGGIKGVPRRSPFVRTDCTLKQRNSLYVIGALKGATTLSLYKSDPESQKWIGLGEIPENSLRAACESWQDRIWRCGGFVDEEKTIRSKRCFSFDGVEWREELSLNIGRAHHSMVSSTKSLYVFGGSGTVSSGEAINVNVRSNTWNVFAWVVDKEPTSPVLIAKRGEEHIWFVGGATHKDTTDIIWRFTPKDGRMIQMGRMTRARYKPQAVFSNRQLDRNAAGRGKHQLMIDGGADPGKLPLIRELCDVWEWKEDNAAHNLCEGVERLGEINPINHIIALAWP